MPGSFISGSGATTAVGSGSGHTSTSVASASKAGSPSSATSIASSPGGSSSKSGSGSSSSNTAAIAGGVAGGVVALAAIGALLFYFLRKRTPPQAPSAAFVVDPAVSAQPAVPQMGQVVSPPLPSDDGSTYAPGTPVSPMKLYVRFYISFRESRAFLVCTHIYTFFFSGSDGSYHIPRIPESADRGRKCPRIALRTKLKWQCARREHDEHARRKHNEHAGREYNGWEPIAWEHSCQHADRATGRLSWLAYRLIVVTPAVVREDLHFHILPA